MSRAKAKAGARWGEPPWRVGFQPAKTRLPAEVDLAIVGGGFTGLAVACAVCRRAPHWSVVVLEAGGLGSGASGRTGGIILDETAFGPLPGLGDVLGGFVHILQEWQIECDLSLPGCWEISRRRSKGDSAIAWKDYGTLRVENVVRGGAIDPGKLVAGLARVAERSGAALHEQTLVRNVKFGTPLKLVLNGCVLRALRVVFATEAYAHAFAGLAPYTRSFFTLVLATGPLSDEQLNALGLAEKIPFYTLDFPYLWGRVFGSNQIIFGGGLVEASTPAELLALDVQQGDAARSLSQLEERVRGLHPVLRDVAINHRWGGPISFPDAPQPILMSHPESSSALVVGGYAGQGIALSVYLSQWIAEALLEGRALPAWGQPH